MCNGDCDQGRNCNCEVRMNKLEALIPIASFGVGVIVGLWVTLLLVVW